VSSTASIAATNSASACGGMTRYWILRPQHAKRVDCEYERSGTASIFLFAEPLAGWREATARTSKTKLDWAVETAPLLEGRYRHCPVVTLVCDNLNTHTIGAFYPI
jgi:hypothetical protein